MAVRFAKIHETSTLTDFPDVDSAVTYTTGINFPGGPIEYLVVRGDITWDVDPAASDISNLLTAIRIIVNGEVLHDFRAGVVGNDDTSSGAYNYFLNSIGGRAYEVPGTTTREWYWGIPLGVQTETGVNRMEIIMEWAAAATNSDPTSGNLSFWTKTNDAMQTKTVVGSATSFTHAANSLEMVTVRIPQNVPGVVSAILVQNDSQADELGSQGIRINSISEFGMEAAFWRWLNGDLENGILFADGGASTAQQQIAIQTPGLMLLPVFGLAGGDVICAVDHSGASTTRTYTPVITSAIGAKEAPTVRQTQAAPASTAQAIVRKTEN